MKSPTRQEQRQLVEVLRASASQATNAGSGDRGAVRSSSLPSQVVSYFLARPENPDKWPRRIIGTVGKTSVEKPGRWILLVGCQRRAVALH